MKRFGLIFLLMGALVFCMGATVWEGSASVSADGELPGEGLFVATGSLPIHTVVDVTNLITGESVRVTVVENLDSPGLLAMLSPETAERLGVGGSSVARIRMIAPYTDAFFQNSEDLDLLEESAETVHLASEPIPAESGAEIAEKTEAAVPNTVNAAVPDAAAPKALAEGAPPESAAVPPALAQAGAGTPAARAGEGKAPAEWPYEDGSYVFKLVPADERPPAAPHPSELTKEEPKPAPVVPPPPLPPPSASAQETLFSVPLIRGGLEKGKFYLQLGAFSSLEHTEKALTRLGITHPRAIQTAGTAERPLYRVLVGPVSWNESETLLQLFKDAGYADAFIRRGTM